MSPHKIIIASSTPHGVMCAQALVTSPLFEIVTILTPAPRPIGRHQTLTPNPLHTWAQTNKIPTLLVEKKLADLQTQLEKIDFDFLLVVDFGYFIPNWLLDLPKIAPVNIHPSALPKYRGASPGQFVLLFGETNSAVSLIKVTDKMDQGDIIASLPFAVDQNWTQQDYYQFAFELITAQLVQLLDDFANGKIVPTPQPLASPTPLARQLDKNDAFITWQTIASSAKLPTQEKNPDTSTYYIKSNQNTSISHKHNQPPLLTSLLENSPTSQQAQIIERACRALYLWPQVWTIYNGKRLQIIKCHLENNILSLDLVKPEGKNVLSFKQFIQQS